MGIFSKLKKVFNPGGTVLSKVIGDGNRYEGVLDYAMKGADNAKKAQAAQQAGSGFAPKPLFSPDPGLNPQAVKLGWTSGGYRYNNNPFAQGPPMAFGGGAPPLQPPPQGGSMPAAGAQPSGPPTMQVPQNPQMVQAAMLRNRGARAM